MEDVLKKTGVTLLVLAVWAGLVVAREPGFEEYRAVQDSLARVHPRLWTRWLSERGLELPGINAPQGAGPSRDSGGLRLVGKYGRGPSVEVTGRDSLVFLSLGSEVAIINMADPDNPEVLSEPQAMGLVTQAAVRDSFLYIGTTTGWAGIEIWNIENPREPVFRNRVLTRLNDFCVQDTLLYLTQRGSSPSRDTFKVYNMADPDNPELIGFCPDSGASVVVSGSTVLLGDWDDIFALDVSDPTNPHRVGQYSGGPLGLAARGSICCASIWWTTDVDHFRFDVLDISDPSNLRRLGYLDEVGGNDVHLDSSLAFISGYDVGQHFRIIDISDSTNPRQLGEAHPQGSNFGVWSDMEVALAYVADDAEGLQILDIQDLSDPVIDTAVVSADLALDLSCQGDLTYVADDRCGLKIVDMSDPAVPVELSSVDTTGARPYMEALTGDDTLAYVAWSPFPNFRMISVGNPRSPGLVGACTIEGNPTAIVLRDTLAYTAGRYRFQVVNVADPRNPERVGVAVLPGTVARNLALCDTMAYVANGSSGGLQCISIADVTTPQVVGSWPGRASSVVGRDSVLYVVAPYTGCVSLSATDPTSPRVLDSLGLPGWYNSVVAVDTLLYVGGSEMVIVDAADPGSLEVLGTWVPPYLVEKVVYAEPYIFAACSQGGVCVLETTHVGMSEDRSTKWPRRRNMVLKPNPARGKVELGLRGLGVGVVSLVDAAGRRAIPDVKVEPGAETLVLRLAGLRAGVYFVEAEGSDGVREVAKLLKN